MNILTIVGGIADAVTSFWCYAVFIQGMCRAFKRGGKIVDFFTAVYYELRPFLPYTLAADHVADLIATGPLGPGRIISDLIVLACWWVLTKYDPDDRWKKRRKKVAEKVARVGGRLVVVPAPSPA